jgi:hypothetical protein
MEAITNTTTTAGDGLICKGFCDGKGASRGPFGESSREGAVAYCIIWASEGLTILACGLMRHGLGDNATPDAGQKEVDAMAEVGFEGRDGEERRRETVSKRTDRQAYGQHLLQVIEPPPISSY